MTEFGYLIAKIQAADFVEHPFRHIYIKKFFNPQHFQEIVTSPEVALRQARDDQDLLHILHDTGYQAITFPGTTTNLKEYIRWHKERDPRRHTNVETCEGLGVTLRLNRYKCGSTLGQLNTFFASAEFLAALHEKFSLDNTKTYVDNGLQKYLDGYEISPHPDIRSKVLTYMININPAQESEHIDFHTHYMQFIPQRDYVKHYWRGNAEVDRCWVPWEWCETIKMQRKNNSIVVFAPADDTLHAVRAAYNHLETQRTQFYGNLWLRDVGLKGKPSWRDYEIRCTPEIPARRNMKQQLKRLVPPSVVKLLRRRHAAKQ